MNVAMRGQEFMAMNSNYDARPRACEALVDGDRAHVVRRRARVAAAAVKSCKSLKLA